MPPENGLSTPSFMSDDKQISVRVRVLDRDYPLKVAARDEAFTRQVAAFVDQRMRKVRQSLPDQHEMTTAVIAILSIAEELFALREEKERLEKEMSGSPTILERELIVLEKKLSAALGPADPRTKSPQG
jgi:cell division protein ZapA